MTTRRSRVAGTSLCTLVALGALTSCMSTPSNRRVVQDQIEALDLPDDQQRCMLDKVDGYTDDQLTGIGDDNADLADTGTLNFEDPDWVASSTEDMQAFVANLGSCLDDTATSESIETTESTEATESTDETETTEAAE